jgi:hypothetical protein
MHKQWRREDVEANHARVFDLMAEQQPVVLSTVIREECERVGRAVLEGDVRFQHAIAEGKPQD